MKLPSAETVAVQLVVALLASIAAAWLLRRLPALSDPLDTGQRQGGCTCR